jgi:hypothetical protein
MIRKQNMKTWLVFLPVILAIWMLAGCAVKKANVWGDPETGLILQYRMPENQVLKYKSSAEVTQTMDVMGQIIDIDIDSSSAFTVKSKGKKENNHQLAVTIDSMKIFIASPQGEITPDMSTVKGKSFEMILSPIGKELELIGADAIQYESPDGTKSISAEFQDTFPDLADRPVKIGDKWPSDSTITDIYSAGESKLHFEGMNTLEGFENVNGMECIKISADVTGTYKGTGEAQGMEVLSEGEIVGKSTCYFAYKEGIFVKMVIEGTAEGTVTVSAQNLEIPMTRKFKNEVELVK